MLWTLEVCLAYLSSTDFNRDTVMLDCDQLVFKDLRPFFAPGADLGLLVRPTPKHRDSWKQLLNGVQFWPLRGKARLIPFYEEALARAARLPEATKPSSPKRLPALTKSLTTSGWFPNPDTSSN